MMEQAEFHKLSDKFLENLAEAIEVADDALDVDYINGILTITLPDDKQFVINKHQPSLQIWLSSPFSGAHRFSYDKNKLCWVGSNSSNLVELLKSEMACLAGLEPATLSFGS